MPFMSMVCLIIGTAATMPIASGNARLATLRDNVSVTYEAQLVVGRFPNRPKQFKLSL
jgi:hypothetical protein